MGKGPKGTALLSGLAEQFPWGLQQRLDLHPALIYTRQPGY